MPESPPLGSISSGFVVYSVYRFIAASRGFICVLCGTDTVLAIVALCTHCIKLSIFSFGISGHQQEQNYHTSGRPWAMRKMHANINPFGYFKWVENLLYDFPRTRTKTAKHWTVKSGVYIYQRHWIFRNTLCKLSTSNCVGQTQRRRSSNSFIQVVKWCMPIQTYTSRTRSISTVDATLLCVLCVCLQMMPV